ncbi:hypothetical protein [Alteraurantiacibacter aquimixticola]|uniref:hypothetical protein n=1 Tax=Alteraurantiacibacter aquimixticola TaxID=2489173 RepID=UPI001B7D9061|nr:hypothetical protein [Alteraurantiacibacter aquimixticola]
MTGISEEPDGATPPDPDELEGLKFRHITTRGESRSMSRAACKGCNAAENGTC